MQSQEQARAQTHERAPTAGSSQAMSRRSAAQQARHARERAESETTGQTSQRGTHSKHVLFQR